MKRSTWTSQTNHWFCFRCRPTVINTSWTCTACIHMTRLLTQQEMRRPFKKLRQLLFFSKNINSFINIYIVPFKVIPLRYNTLVPILEALLISTFWYSLELFQRCSLLNRSKSPSFHGSLRFGKQEPFAGGQVWLIRWLRHDYGVIIGQKITNKQWLVSWRWQIIAKHTKTRQTSWICKKNWELNVCTQQNYLFEN